MKKAIDELFDIIQKPNHAERVDLLLQWKVDWIGTFATTYTINASIPGLSRSDCQKIVMDAFCHEIAKCIQGNAEMKHTIKHKHDASGSWTVYISEMGFIKGKK